MALSIDGQRLFVAERIGRILALEVDSGVVLQSIDLRPMGYSSIGGLAVSPTTGVLYFVDMNANEVVKIEASRFTDGGVSYKSLVNLEYKSQAELAQDQVEINCAGNVIFSLTRDYTCEVDGAIPNGTLFEQVSYLQPSEQSNVSRCHKNSPHLVCMMQVHNDGYASNDPDVQSTAGMDESAALLANRTDCEADSELNLDALLLGGYYCHICLPQNHGSSCEQGGNCQNIQWQGFSCDNEYYVDFNKGSDSLALSSLYFDTTYANNDVDITLFRGITYRFTVRTGADHPVRVNDALEPTDDIPTSLSRFQSPTLAEGVTSGPILLTLDDTSPDALYLTSPRLNPITLVIKDKPAETHEKSQGIPPTSPAGLRSHCGALVSIAFAAFLSLFH